MNNQKTEAKAADHEDGDHTQPINLVAPRPPTPASTGVTTFSGLTTPVANQPVALRPHSETSKPGLMTLYFRTPSTTRPSGPGHIMSPVMGAQVASAQHFTAKQALKSFKSMRVGYYQDKLTDKTGSEYNIKVIRVPPSDNMQSQSSSTTPSATTLSPGILPNALAGNSSRHIIPAAVHPGISTGSSISGSMASIIKSGHQVSQVSHALHQPFSSHVPRGPAAVASISAGPRSGVATPIVRAPHSSGNMTLASSMISPNAHVRVRSQTMTTGRTPVASSASYPQVIDLQKNSVGHSVAPSQAQIGQTSRSLDMASSVRTGLPHPSSVTIAKPINISQPIVQHLQQVSEKGCLKTVSGITSTTTVPSNSTPAHQNTTVLAGGHSSGGEVHSVCIVPTITRATVSSSGAYTTGIVQFPAAAIPQHVPALRPSLVQPQALTTGMNISAPQGNQAFAVISAKSLQPNNQSMTLAAQSCRTPICTTVVVPSCGSITSVSTLTPTSARVLNTPSSVCQAAIPIAKVYPQPLPVVSQACTTSSSLESMQSSAFVTQATNLSNVSTLKSVTTSPTTATTTAVSNALHTSPIMKRSESTTSVRFAPLSKQQVAGGTSFAVPSASYLYDQCPGTLQVHPYSVASTNQGFSTALPASHIQTFALSQHGNSNITTASHQSVCVPASSSSSMQPLNSLMVAVDSRHVALPYNRVTIGAGKTVTELVTHAPTTSTTHTSSASANLVALSQASSTHGMNHSQGNLPNHLSPRPSILRKRTAEGITSVAKRNLLSSLCTPDPGSPSSDFIPTMNLSATGSQKPTNGQLRENGVMFAFSDNENCLSLTTPIPVIKKEPGIEENTMQVTDDMAKDSRLVEASPRKKPRKQLLAANELIETHSSDGDEQFEMKTSKEIKTEDDNVKWVTFGKRPTMSLLPHNRQGWKSRHNHFARYCDVKPKEEKQPTVNEYANQKGISEEVNGWKVHHLTGQMEDLIECEESVYSRLSHWLELEKKNSTTLINVTSTSEDIKIINKLTDLVKGNLQRSKIAQEQASESQQQIIKILDHKPNIIDILSKYTSRRQSKKKEKT